MKTANIGIFYGSTTGNTESIAKIIQRELGGELHDISGASAQDFEKYNVLILGSPTYGMGELQDDWDEFASHLEGIDFSGKNVAFFGLGDQESYPDTFQDAMGILYEKVSCAGGVTVGAQRVEGYDFSESKAVVGGNFVGLPIDEENQSDLTEERIRTWTEQVRGEIDL